MNDPDDDGYAGDDEAGAGLVAAVVTFRTSASKNTAAGWVVPGTGGALAVTAVQFGALGLAYRATHVPSGLSIGPTEAPALRQAVTLSRRFAALCLAHGLTLESLAKGKLTGPVRQGVLQGMQQARAQFGLPAPRKGGCPV